MERFVENKTDKGLFEGSCNRKVCQDKDAVYYNHSTRLYYCRNCADLINEANPESYEMYGHELCTYGEHSERTM